MGELCQRNFHHVHKGLNCNHLRYKHRIKILRYMLPFYYYWHCSNMYLAYSFSFIYKTFLSVNAIYIL